MTITSHERSRAPHLFHEFGSYIKSDTFSLNISTHDHIELAQMTGGKLVDTPIEPNAKYSKNNAELLSDPSLYKILVGHPIYLTTTRPDIFHVVRVARNFIPTPHLH